MSTTKKGYFMMIVLWFAYATFAMNWVAGSSLTPQITAHFFGNQTVDPLISQLVNYSITTARVFANILAALILMKLGPKKAPLLALLFLMMSIVAIYLPNYWAYTVARMVMGLGGSMVIVYMNPVVTRYVQDPAEKLRINAFNTVSYNVGAFVVSLLFTLFANQFVSDWKLTLTIFASLTAILFFAWWIGSESFDLNDAADADETPYGYGDAVRDPFLWKYAVAFGGFLTLYILSLVGLKPVFDAYTQLNGSLVNLLVSGAGIVGTFVGLRIGNKGTPRKPILLISGTVMIASFLVTVLFGNISPLVSYVFAFISGFAMYIQYPIFMNLAHERKGMTPQKITVLFGLFWAIAYATQTIFTIIWSYALGHAGYTVSMIVFFLCCSVYLFFTFFLPETKPKRTNALRKSA